MNHAFKVSLACFSLNYGNVSSSLLHPRVEAISWLVTFRFLWSLIAQPFRPPVVTHIWEYAELFLLWLVLKIIFWATFVTACWLFWGAPTCRYFRYPYWFLLLPPNRCWYYTVLQLIVDYLHLLMFCISPSFAVDAVYGFCFTVLVLCFKWVIQTRSRTIMPSLPHSPKSLTFFFCF